MRQRSINFSAAMRDMRRERVELTPEQRAELREKRIREAVEAAGKQRRSLRKFGG